MTLKQRSATIMLAFTALALSACGSNASETDIGQPTFEGNASTDILATTPDEITVFQNVDRHPTIVRICIDGVAFRTISTTHSGLASPAVDRVPEWDETC